VSEGQIHGGVIILCMCLENGDVDWLLRLRTAYWWEVCMEFVGEVFWRLVACSHVAAAAAAAAAGMHDSNVQLPVYQQHANCCKLAWQVGFCLLYNL
jgi:hypothetical protein